MVFRQRMTAGLRLAAVTVLMLALAACNATPAPTATPVPLPAVAVDVSDTALTMPADVPAGMVQVTVSNSGQAPHSPARGCRRGATVGRSGSTVSPLRCDGVDR